MVRVIRALLLITSWLIVAVKIQIIYPSIERAALQFVNGNLDANQCAFVAPRRILIDYKIHPVNYQHNFQWDC